MLQRIVTRRVLPEEEVVRTTTIAPERAIRKPATLAEAMGAPLTRVEKVPEEQAKVVTRRARRKRAA